MASGCFMNLTLPDSHVSTSPPIHLSGSSWPWLRSVMTASPLTADHIPSFRAVGLSSKSPQGGLRQSVVTHVTSGAKSEHGGQRDASTLEIYAGGFIVAYFIREQREVCSDVCFALVNWDVLQRGTCTVLFTVSVVINSMSSE
ncbi:uncharacterized protein V6R79_008329 [Siganus canaliculatus]